jgi:uncharacterized SAM-binding protein YcdF (DUF218 family)
MRNDIAALVLPPTGLVLLALMGFLLHGGWHRTGRRIVWAALIALLLLGMPAVSGTLLRGLETDLPTTPPAGNPPQAIIVLGADAIHTRDEPLAARPGLLTLDRLRTAAELHRRTGLPILVTGGTEHADTPSVARVMQQSLTDDFLTPPRWVEPKSADTWENARFSAAILKPEGITSVYVVTHAWHMRRALLAFQGTGLTVTAGPTARDNPPSLHLDDFLPRAGGWQTAYYALHEWIGYVFYTLRR